MDEKEVSEMQEEMMTVLVVEPMKAPYVKHIPNELEDLQQAVGGDIEMTYPFDDEVGILLNGNGKFEGLPLNRALYDDHGQVYDAIAGTFLVVGLTEDDFTSLTPEQIEKFKEKYQSPAHNIPSAFLPYCPDRYFSLSWHCRPAMRCIPTLQNYSTHTESRRKGNPDLLRHSDKLLFPGRSATSENRKNCHHCTLLPS
jgi:hypothetical protein